jgi:sugar lactone lactonase YvrE
MTVWTKNHLAALPLISFLLLLVSLIVGPLLSRGISAQTIVAENGVRIVHNAKGGVWGTAPKVSIELVRTIGDVDSDDENLAFNSPADLAVDTPGNIYIADSQNQRIQVFDPEGRYLRTVGRKGQGPGEFMSTRSIDFDGEGRFHVLDNRQRRIQVFASKGEVLKTIPVINLDIYQMRLLRSGKMAVEGNRRGPKLVKILGPDLAPQQEFGDPFDFGDELANSVGNSWDFTVDREDNIYLCFLLQNRIEKFSPDGQLLWRADRELNYPAKMVEKGRREGARTFYPKFNSVARSLDADGSGRIWVVTCDRQIKKDEEVIVMYSGRVGGAETRKVVGDTDLKKTDMYKLEIFRSDGILLGEIPLTHFVDKIWVHQDRLFLLDSDRGVCFYEYKIVEK